MLGWILKDKIRNPLYDRDTLVSTVTLAVSRPGPAALKREQWDRSENEHREKRKKNDIQEDVERTDLGKEEQAVQP
jgi:hypothetical protein